MAGTGIGATLVFSGGLTFSTTGIIRSISSIREFTEALDNTTLDTTGYRKYCADDLKDIDPIEFTFLADQGLPRPAVGSTGTLTLTFAPADSGSMILSGSGFFLEWSTAEQTPGVRLEATAQFKFDNDGTAINWQEGA